MKYNKINYFLTGLRQHYKPEFNVKNLQSYYKCDRFECKKYFLKIFKKNKTNYEYFIYTLNKLYEKKKILSLKLNNSNNYEAELNQIINNGFIFLEKKDNCSFPNYIYLTRNNNNLFSKSITRV